MRHLAFGNQPAFQELPHYRPQALMHHEFRGDQQGYRHEKADVDLQVQQEGYSRKSLEKTPFESGEPQQRQPCEQRDEENTLSHQHQCIVGQVRPEQKLEEWSAQHKREVCGVPNMIFIRHGCQHVSNLKCDLLSASVGSARTPAHSA